MPGFWERGTNLENGLYLTEVASCAGLDKGDARGHAHLVHVSARVWHGCHKRPVSG